MTVQEKFGQTENSGRKDKPHSRVPSYSQKIGGVTIHKATLFLLQSSAGRTYSGLAILFMFRSDVAELELLLPISDCIWQSCQLITLDGRRGADKRGALQPIMHSTDGPFMKNKQWGPTHA